MWKSEGKRQLGRLRLRWEDNFKTSQEKWWSGMDWIDLAQDNGKCQAVVNTVMNSGVP